MLYFCTFTHAHTAYNLQILFCMQSICTKKIVPYKNNPLYGARVLGGVVVMASDNI